MAGALDGIRVIDFGQWLAGPLTALLLADQGAEVIHVDPPGGPAWKTVANATLQRGKQRIVLDLKSTADLASARGLISSADVVIENFRPGVMDRLGLGWDAVRRGHDRLIYCSLPGFAADDPRAAMPAWEGVLAAATGTYTRSGAEDQPRFNALPLASEFGALAAAIAIVMALIARERDGLGQRLEVPLFDAMFLAFGASALLVNGAAAGGRPADPWSGTYQCRDGAMVLLNLATPRFVRRFLEATGTLQTWTAKGYLEPDRLVHDSELWAQHKHELSALLRTRTAEEWDALATQVLLPLTRIRTSAAWMESQHAQDAGIIVPVDDPEYGRMLQPGPSVRLTRTAQRRRRATLRATRGHPRYEQPRALSPPPWKASGSWTRRRCWRGRQRRGRSPSLGLRSLRSTTPGKKGRGTAGRCTAITRTSTAASAPSSSI